MKNSEAPLTSAKHDEIAGRMDAYRLLFGHACELEVRLRHADRLLRHVLRTEDAKGVRSRFDCVRDYVANETAHVRAVANTLEQRWGVSLGVGWQF